MIEPRSPTDRLDQGHPVRQGTRLGRRVALLAALVVLGAAPLSAAGRAPPSASTDRSVPRIAFLIESYNAQQGRIVTVRADGKGGVRELVAGTHNDGFCQSADGRKMAYFSDKEAPHEYFLYVANADGTHAKKITEEQVGFQCHFSKRWLVLTRRTGGWDAMTIVRHDLQTGAETTIVSGADRLSLSPDGRKLLFVGGLDFTPAPGQARPKGRETLELLDLATLARRRLAGPLPRARSYAFYSCCETAGWSRDGGNVAYTVGPSYYPQHLGPVHHRARALSFQVYVEPVAGGAARRVLRLSGSPPSISWSSDDRKLLVCAQNQAIGPSYWYGEGNLGCNGGTPGRGKNSQPPFAGKLLLVNLRQRSVRSVASGKKLLFAQWAPSGTPYSYATKADATTAAVYVARPGGARRMLASAPQRTWAGSWIGWSPGGRYIGLGDFASHLTVLNVVTGRIRVLARDRGNQFNSIAKWWR